MTKLHAKEKAKTHKCIFGVPHVIWCRRRARVFGVSSSSVILILLTFCPLVSSADDIRKQFGPRSGPTKRRARFGSKLFVTLRRIFTKKTILKKKKKKKKKQQTTIKHEKIPSMHNVKASPAMQLQYEMHHFRWYHYEQVRDKSKYCKFIFSRVF